MNDYDVYGNFINTGQISSARQLATRQKARNPIIETDKNTENLVNISKQQTNILNANAQITKENAKTIKYLANQIEEMQKTADKQYRTSLLVSILAGIFAFGSFILALIQCFR